LPILQEVKGWSGTLRLPASSGSANGTIERERQTTENTHDRLGKINLSPPMADGLFLALNVVRTESHFSSLLLTPAAAAGRDSAKTNFLLNAARLEKH
jgi:hypothetical protein